MTTSDILTYTLMFLLVFFVCCLFVVREVRYHKDKVLFDEHMKILRKRAMDKVLGEEKEDDAH